MEWMLREDDLGSGKTLTCFSLSDTHTNLSHPASPVECSSSFIAYGLTIGKNRILRRTLAVVGIIQNVLCGRRWWRFILIIFPIRPSAQLLCVAEIHTKMIVRVWAVGRPTEGRDTETR